MNMFSRYSSIENRDKASAILLGALSGLIAGCALLHQIEKKIDRDTFKKEPALKMVDIDAEGRVGFDKDGDLKPDYRAKMKTSVREFGKVQSGTEWFPGVDKVSVRRVFQKSQESADAFGEETQLDFICMDEHGVIHFDRNGDGHADYYAKLQKGQTLKQEDIGQQKSGAEWMKFVDAQKVSKWADQCK